MASKLEAALALAAKGFEVFPIKAGTKAPPLIQEWPEAASSRGVTIHHWWTKWPDANIGIHCAGMIVIDVDPKNGGDETFAFLEDTYGFPPTLTCRTPTGGRHVYLRSPVAVSNSVGSLAAGLDIRTDGGYCVAPGSEVAAGRYEWVDTSLPVADAPDWLVAKLDTSAKRVEKADKNEHVEDAPLPLVERAAEWLARQAPAIEGEGGDAHTFKVACGLRDLGVSVDQALSLLASWNERCSPPWSPRELTVKVRNAYAYGQNAPGVAAARPDDFPLAEPAPAKPRPRVARLDALAASEARGPGYLIKGLLARRTYAEVFGAPGEGKTFVALDMAYSVAAGAAWMGRRVHPGLVLYLAYEGQGGLVKRAQALRKKYGSKEVPLYVAGVAFNLRDAAGRRELGELIAGLPEKPVLIVIDTFARALMGGDENSAQDVGAFNSAVAALIESTGACVCIVHHSGKNKAAGARGSSALQGAIDTEIEVDQGRVTASKQRDMETGEPIGFKLTPVIVGLDEDGDEVTSCVVEPDTVAAGPNGKLTGNAKRGFDVLCDIRPNNDPVTDVEWREACKGFIDKNLAQRFYDIKTQLRRKGWIVVDGDGLVTRRCE